MKYGIYSVYDRVREGYSPLQLFETRDAALRAFSDVVNDDNGLIFKSPDDFSLCELGTFDVTSGKIECCEVLVVQNARAVVTEPKDDKFNVLLNRLRRFESQLAALQDQIDGGSCDE